MEEHLVTVTLRRGEELDLVFLDLGDGNCISLQGDLRRWAESLMPPPKIDMKWIEDWSSAFDATASEWVRALLDVVRAGHRYHAACVQFGKDSPQGRLTFIEWATTIERFKEGQ